MIVSTRIEYIANKRGENIGITLAYVDHPNKVIHIGWSKCNMKLDKFDVGQGIFIALECSRHIDNGNYVDIDDKYFAKKVKDFIRRIVIDIYNDLLEDFNFSLNVLLPHEFEDIVRTKKMDLLYGGVGANSLTKKLQDTLEFLLNKKLKKVHQGTLVLSRYTTPKKEPEVES